MTQVDRISEKVGGDDELARLSGVTVSAVSHWRHRGNGLIPASRHQQLINDAKKERIRLLPSDFYDFPSPRNFRRKSRKTLASAAE